jgi:ketosteroid isomerase-like protein
MYTNDAKFYPPNGMMVEGTEGITKAFEGMIDAGLIIEPKAQEVEIFGAHAYEYGIGSVYNREGEKLREERYVCVWKHVEGDWKIYRDLVQGVEIK